ncbi:hypothetical protein [Salinirussus salinus]|uniref:hypothetical protein n=1 Tax=Salinirussus salinus TaxID=1198300 RepID=UPI00135B459B|nr:hypothetical protein [Salinirussus salinus]
MASDNGDDDLTAMERYWRDEGVTDQQREALVEEGLDDPAQEEGVEVDNTVATETTDSGEVVNTVTVDSAEEDSDIVTTESTTGVTESGDVALVDSPGSSESDGSGSGGSSDSAEPSDQASETSMPSIEDVMPNTTVVGNGSGEGLLSGVNRTTALLVALALGGAYLAVGR